MYTYSKKLFCLHWLSHKWNIHTSTVFHLFIYSLLLLRIEIGNVQRATENLHDHIICKPNVIHWQQSPNFFWMHLIWWNLCGENRKKKPKFQLFSFRLHFIESWWIKLWIYCRSLKDLFWWIWRWKFHYTSIRQKWFEMNICNRDFILQKKILCVVNTINFLGTRYVASGRMKCSEIQSILQFSIKDSETRQFDMMLFIGFYWLVLLIRVFTFVFFFNFLE